MLRSLLLLLALPGLAFSQVGSIDANVDTLPQSPRFYTVVGFPANYKTDPLCQDIIKGFQADATLKELRSRTKVALYDETDPDWKYRFSSRVSELPVVMVMDGDEIVYKRSKANAKTISEEIRGGRLFNRFPRICPPDGPCPDDQPSPNNRPNRPTPKEPTTPSRPLIPDTAPVLTPETPLPPAPVTPAVDDQTVKELTDRIKALEMKLSTLTLTEGKAGRDGTNGKDGINGKDATVDYTTIQNNIQKWALDHKGEFKGADGKSPTIDLNALIPQIVAKLPPITFERLDQNGRALDSIEVYLGKTAKFPPLTVNYLDTTGRVLDTEYVPSIGGVLNLRIDVLNKGG